MSDRPSYFPEPRSDRDFDRKDTNSRDDSQRNDNPRSEHRSETNDRPRRDDSRPDTRRDDRGGERPRRDDRGGERSFSNDRPRRDDNRPSTGERPRRDDRGGERSFSNDRPRRDDNRPSTGERPRRDDRGGERSFSNDRPRRDDNRPSTGERPRRDDNRPFSNDRPRRDDNRPSTGERPRRDDRGGERSFGGDRPRRDDNRPFSNDRPRRDDNRPSTGERPRRDDNRPSTGERPRRDDRGGERSFSNDRPRRDDNRPSTGERPRRDDRGGERSFGGDRPRRDGERSFGSDRPRRDGERSFGSDRPRRDDSRPDARRDDRGGFKRDDRGGERKEFHKDRGEFRSNDRGDFKDKERGDARGDAPRKGVMDLIREADVELLRMLARRTRLREKLSERYAGAKERDLRTSWEEAAARVSRDPRLLRDMFTLLQQIDVNAPDVDAPQAFTLSPNVQPVRIDLPVAASTRQTRLRMALAAGAGAELLLENALLNSEVVACLKMFNCAGAALRWEENPDRVECAATSPICGSTLPMLDKVIYVGDDPFNFYLMLFQLLTRPSRVKFMGESTLRFLDVSPLRHFVPALGARLTSVVPGEDGLPARMESSAILPDNITVPADIPADAVVALLAATPFWTGTVRVDLEARPDVSLGEVLPLLRACGCTVEDNGVALVITPPARPTMPAGNDMDLLAAFPLLAFAGCAGGESTVRGHWPKDHPYGQAALELLRGVALVEVGDDAVTATGLPADCAPPLDPDFLALPVELLGPALALYLFRCRDQETPALPLLPAGHDAEVVDGFLAVLGYTCGEEYLTKTEPVRVPWAAPSAWWGMGLVLASFFVPKLRMANPAVITTLLPQFWGMFNALPEPALERPKTESDMYEEMPEEPRRRRVLAEYMPESEMPQAIEYEEED